MESQVLTLFRKLFNSGIFNMSWMPIESNHYLIGIFDNRIYVSVLDQDQTPRSTDHPSIAYYGVKPAYSTMMAQLSAPITNPDGQWKVEYSEHGGNFEAELEKILQAMVDTYPPEVGEIASLGFSSMAFPNLGVLIGKLNDIALGADKLVIGNEMKSSLPPIKPQELANRFFSRLEEIGVKPPFCIPYYYQVGGSSYTISMDPEAKAITICIEVNVGKFKTFAFVSPESFPHEAAVHQEFLVALEGGFRSVAEFAGKTYEKLLLDISEGPWTREGGHALNALQQRYVEPRVTAVTDQIKENMGYPVSEPAMVIAKLCASLTNRGLFQIDRIPFVTRDGQVAVFVSRQPFLISVCTNTGNVLEVPAGHLEGSGTGFKRICWIRHGRTTWAEDLGQLVNVDFGYPQLEATLKELLVTLEGEGPDPLGRGLTANAAMRLMVEQNPHLYNVDPAARAEYIADLKKKFPGIINDDGGIDVISLAAKGRRKSKTLDADPGFAKWAPGPKGYIPRETFGNDTEAYITHLERVIEIGRMTPAEFMEDAKRSAKELEQMYPHAAQILDLPGGDADRQVDWSAIVTPPAFMPKAPLNFTISLPRDPLFDSFANSEFVHRWMDLIHTTNEQFRLAGGERLSSVESSIRFEVPGMPNPKLLVRPADGQNKFYLEEDQPKGARLADLTLDGDRITVDIHNDEVFPIAGAEDVLTAMLKAVKEHMTK